MDRRAHHVPAVQASEGAEQQLRPRLASARDGPLGGEESAHVNGVSDDGKTYKMMIVFLLMITMMLVIMLLIIMTKAIIKYID